MIEEAQKSSANNSDSDDWTLVSPPHSLPSTPERDSNVEEFSQQLHGMSPTSSNLRRQVEGQATDKVEGDCMMDIDLSTNSTIDCAKAIIANESDISAGSAEPEVRGFQPLDSTTDEDDSNDGSEDPKSSRSSSLTRSELGEYVYLEKEQEKEIGDDGAIQVTETLQTTDSVVSPSSCHISKNTSTSIMRVSHFNLAPWESRLKESLFLALSNCYQMLGISRSQPNVAQASNSRWLILFLHMIILLHMSNVYQDNKLSSPTKTQSTSIHPKDTTYPFNSPRYHITLTYPQEVELQSLHNELIQCIKRQSPSLFKSYLSSNLTKEDEWKHDIRQRKKPRAHRGLVCHGHENRWQAKMSKLKSELDLDLHALVQKAKRHLTNELLESQNPNLKFDLILNQLEYLEFMETKRNKKKTDDLVKNLKAASSRHSNCMSHPKDTEYKRIAIELQLENYKLQRENELLKMSLGRKARTTLMIPTQELERYDYEGPIMDQSYQKAARLRVQGTDTCVCK